MQELIGDLVAYAFVVAASPLPIIAVLLLLAAPGGIRIGGLFVLARVVVLATLVTVAALLADLADDAAGSQTPAAVLRILLGLVLVGVAVRKWLRRPRGADAVALPGWMRAIDGVGPGGALRLGALVTAVNLKELAMAVGAGLTLGGADASVAEASVAGVVFVVLSTLGVTLPLLALLVGGERASARLADARDWFVRHNATLIAVVMLAIGGVLIGGGIGALG
ncbi:GAP family protein [Protaetiibacter sp. SSC-01]|uniref:GAP family protein n=1 Tax=Protaetiibacter sp. SSC-01 TaxID=2759943 RepID=UPI001656CE0E|nr:GAP family protein [Protaetiibacter sp. SSC-01]QNO37286.1 GAP family protein [Protaetiibacter sp. SSC-01]